MAFEFKRTRIDKIPREARVGSSTVVRTFGAWSKAMEVLRGRLRRRGVDFKARRKGYFSDRELFAELKRVWAGLGHRPSRFEWEEARPTISYQTYKRYFGGWQEACLRFLERRARGGPAAAASPESATSRQKSKLRRGRPEARRGSREVPAGLRLKVYERDRFRCVFCGRSPISELTIELHVDHVGPFIRGGETALANLQTLCSMCNLGKGARHDVLQPGVRS